MQTEVWARRAFKYNDVERSHGAIFKLRGMRNDEKLVRLGFVRKCTALDLEKKVQCGACSDWFIGPHELNLHGKKHHSNRGESIRPTASSKIETPEHSRMVGEDIIGGIEDSQAERREEKDMNERAPIFFENTKASRDAGENVIEIQQPVESVAKEALETSKEFLDNTGEAKKKR